MSDEVPDWARDEVMATLNCYSFISERIKALRAERAQVVARMMPRAGSSLVKLGGKGAGTRADPTANAAAALADHPFIKKLDRLIAYWQEQRARVDLLLPMLTPAERKLVDLYIDGEEEWPSMTREELRRTRRRVVEKAARAWGLI